MSRLNHNSMRAAQVFAATLLLAISAWAQGMGGAMNKGIISPPSNMRPPTLQNVGIEQRLDAQVPPGLAFVDETGRAVKLGDYFTSKPLILDLVYYTCPMLCGESLAGLTGSLRLVKFDAGKEFDVLIVSFDPHDTPARRRGKKGRLREALWPRGRGLRLAFPYRLGGIDQRAHQGGRFSVSV